MKAYVRRSDHGYVAPSRMPESPSATRSTRALRRDGTDRPDDGAGRNSGGAARAGNQGAGGRGRADAVERKGGGGSAGTGRNGGRGRKEAPPRTGPAARARKPESAEASGLGTWEWEAIERKPRRSSASNGAAANGAGAAQTRPESNGGGARAPRAKATSNGGPRTTRARVRPPRPEQAGREASGSKSRGERALRGRLAELRLKAGTAPTGAVPADSPTALRERPGDRKSNGRAPARGRAEAAPATPAPAKHGGGGGGEPPRRRLRGRRGPRKPSKSGTRLRWIRIGLVLSGLACLAGMSTVFGMMMAVASELPALDNQAEFRAAQNSVLLAGDRQFAKVTGNKNRILLREGEVSPMIENAVIAIEDRRFFEHEGIDARGIVRALWADVRQGQAVQGASTLTQQFVKNALVAQDERTIFQKLREAALAYHLERQWSKRKIMTQYLNAVYFGNGAYGIESAVRTYFGKSRGGVTRNERAAAVVEPHEAALLAGRHRLALRLRPDPGPEDRPRAPQRRARADARPAA